jgi:hypothetical protein
VSSPNVDLLMFYRSEIKFQSDLLSSRLNALISSQSFLVLGYATATSGLLGRWQDSFALLVPPALALLGLILSLYARPGIRAAHAAIEHWHAEQRKLFSREPELEEYRVALSSEQPGPGRGPATPKRLREGTAFAVRAPWIFAVAWCYFGALPVLLHWRQ